MLAISEKLADEGYNIMILDEMLDTLTDEILDKAFVFGIGAMIGYQINSALKVAKRIKESNPEIPIIWGGWHPSIQPEQTIRNRYVDFEEWADFQVGLHHASTPWTDEKIAKIVYQANFFFPFVSNVVYKVISQYPLYKRMFLLPLERILFLSMNLRLKKKFFSFPVEYYIVKTFFLVKNRLSKNI